MTDIRIAATRFAVIGDLHLGRPGSALACRLTESEVAAAAEALAATHEAVVVNGDLYDLERGTTPLQGREYRLLEPIHRATVEHLSGAPFVWTRGNHDRVLGKLGQAVEHVDVDTPLGRIRVEHGDRFNPPIKRWPAFTTLVTWASGRARAVPALSPAYRAMRLAERVLGGHDGEQDEPISRGAAQWVDGSPEHVGIVIGHTHVSLLRTLPTGRFVLNPGPSTEQLRALSFDTAAGRAALLEWRESEFVETSRIDLASGRC